MLPRRQGREVALIFPFAFPKGFASFKSAGIVKAVIQAGLSLLDVVVHQVENGQRGGLQSRNLPDSHSPCATSRIPYRFMERSPSPACREMHKAEYTCGVLSWAEVKLLKPATWSRIFCFIPVSLLSCLHLFPGQGNNEGNLQLWFEGSVVIQAYGDTVCLGVKQMLISE